MNLVALLLAVSAPAGPADSPCRLVADWDADRDLVVYEVRRDDCSAPAPALTGRRANRRHKSRFELYQLSTGKLVEAADCEISFSLVSDEAACDLAVLRRERKTFGALRAKRRGEPIPADPEALLLPGAGGVSAVKISGFGETVVTATRAGSHRFFVLQSGRDQILVPVPDQTVAPKRRQADLLTQAASLADAQRLDEGRLLVKAARAQGPFDVAQLAAFCAHPDLARRIENWRAAFRDLDVTERTTLEAALRKRRCFGRLDLAAYDAAAAPMAAARLWLDAFARQDLAAVARMSSFPLRLQGLSPYNRPEELAACGGRVDKPDQVINSTLAILDPAALRRAAPCLRGRATSSCFREMPALRDGRWPPNRSRWFEGWVGTTLPARPDTLPRDLLKIVPVLAPMLGGATAVQAVLTDNDGMTDSFVLLLVPSGGEWRVRAVFGAERFEE